MRAAPSALWRLISSQLVARRLRSIESTYQRLCRSALLFRRSSGASHEREENSFERSASVTAWGTCSVSRSSACLPCVPARGTSRGTRWKKRIRGWSGYIRATSMGSFGVGVPASTWALGISVGGRGACARIALVHIVRSVPLDVRIEKAAPTSIVDDGLLRSRRHVGPRGFRGSNKRVGSSRATRPRSGAAALQAPCDSSC